MAEISKFLAENIKTRQISLSYPLTKFLHLVVEMKKKNLLHYELYGTSARGENTGYWRWAIFAGREEKPLKAGSFYGTLEEAKEHAEFTISSLKQRARRHTTPRSK
jgi:hypothetical protein